MKRLLFFLVFFNLLSCDYFDKKKVYTKDILEEQLQTFNWKDVDEYPTFESCESSSGKENKKVCFENTLRNILNKNLTKYQIIVSEDINDTVKLHITINNKGELVLDEIISTEITETQIPELDSLLRYSLDSLPKIYPALKRSQPVTTQFVLPVIIKID